MIFCLLKNVIPVELLFNLTLKKPTMVAEIYAYVMKCI